MVAVVEFIDIIKNCESIWNMKHPEFRNRKNKAHLWKAISKEVGWTVENCKKKWKALRDSFFRENAKYVMSGQGTESQTGKWAYYNNLKFLSEMNLRSRIRRARKYLKEEFETTGLIESLPTTSQHQSSFIETLDNSEEASFSSPSLPPPLPEPSSLSPVRMSHPKITNSSRKRSQVFGVSSSIRRPRLKRKLNIEKNILETMCNINSFMQQHQHQNEESDDEDTLFCKIVMKKLKKFPLHKKNKLKVTLLTILNEEEERSCESQNIKTIL